MPVHKPRIRRGREEARRAILEAAAVRLRAGGPEAVRVQRVAADLGITDAAIHHHFGSRQGLMAALMRFAGRRIRDDLARILADWDGKPDGLVRVAEMLAEAYSAQGASRLALWLAQSGWRSPGSGLFEPLVDAVHRVRLEIARTRGTPRPQRRETQHDVALLNLALAAEPLFGAGFLRSVGLDEDEASQRRFRRRLIERLSTVLLPP